MKGPARQAANGLWVVIAELQYSVPVIVCLPGSPGKRLENFSSFGRGGVGALCALVTVGFVNPASLCPNGVPRSLEWRSGEQLTAVTRCYSPLANGMVLW